MTAYPVTCLVDLADGYRTTITIEDGDAEQRSVARMTVQSEHPPITLRIELSPESVEALMRELSERASPLAGDPIKEEAKT